MNNQALQDIIKLTQECLSRYWQKDCEFVLQYFDKDVLWVGSIQYQFLSGFEAAADDLRQSVKDFPPCHLLKQEFTAVQNCGNACTIVGRYLTTTDESVGYFMQV